MRETMHWTPGFARFALQPAIAQCLEGGLKMPQQGITRRSFLEKLLVATGAVSSGVIAGSAYVAMTGDEDGLGAPPAASGTEWETLSQSALQLPAQAVTAAEVGRHPTAMPTNANWTLFEGGEYQRTVERTGPLVQEVHFEIQEIVAEVVPGTTMDYWTFDGGVPGPMIRSRVGDTIDFFLHNPQGNGLPHN